MITCVYSNGLLHHSCLGWCPFCLAPVREIWYTSRLYAPSWIDDSASKGALTSLTSQSESQVEIMRLTDRTYMEWGSPFRRYSLGSFPIHIPMIYHGSRELSRNNMIHLRDKKFKIVMFLCFLLRLIHFVISCLFLRVSPGSLC